MGGKGMLPAKQRPGRGEGLLLAPGSKGIDARALARPFQFVETVGQVTQARQYRRRAAMSDAAGIFPETDVTPVMGAVFNRRPMAANTGQDLLIVAFGDGQARDIIADFDGGRVLPLGQVDRLALDGDDLPAATEPDFFRRHFDAGDTAAFQPPMLLFPGRLVFRGKKPAGPAGGWLGRGCRFGFLLNQKGNPRPVPG